MTVCSYAFNVMTVPVFAATFNLLFGIVIPLVFAFVVLILFAYSSWQLHRSNALRREIREVKSAVFEAFPDVYFRVDVVGTIREISPTIAALMGKSAEELRQQCISVIFHDRGDWDAFYKKIAVCLSVQDYEVNLQSDSGEKIPCLISAVLRKTKKRPSFIVGFIRDIRERKREEEEQREFSERMKEVEKLEAIGVLAGGIGHDFNNILFGSIGFAELALKDAEPGSRSEKCLKKILVQLKRGAKLIDQLLTFSRKNEDQLKEVRLQPIIKETVKFFRSSLPENIVLKSRISADAGEAKADPIRIYQILVNLGSNSVQAMSEGGVLTITLEQVKRGTDDFPEYINVASKLALRLTVEDTGEGIDTTVKNRIFEPFFSTRGVGKGDGMGLAVVHGIVESMQGDVYVYSSKGEGTRVSIFLPVSKKNAAEG